LSPRLATCHPCASPFWPPTGLAILTLLLLGQRYWPAIFLGAFLVNLTTAGSLFTSLGIAAGNALEAVTATYLVSRFANGKDVFDRTRDILLFALYGGILSTAVAATFGVTSLALGGFAPWRQYAIIWRTWWLGDAAGALVFTPFLLLWCTNLSWKWSKPRFAEAAALLVSTLLISGIVFGPLLHSEVRNDPWTFLCTPFLIWAAEKCPRIVHFSARHFSSGRRFALGRARLPRSSAWCARLQWWVRRTGTDRLRAGRRMIRCCSCNRFFPSRRS